MHTTIPPQTELTRNAAGRLRKLADRLRGWDQLVELYAGEHTEDEEAAAFAERGKRIAAHSVRRTLQITLAGLEGEKKHFKRLLRRLEESERRERKMAQLLRDVLLRSDRKEGAA